MTDSLLTFLVMRMRANITEFDWALERRVRILLSIVGFVYQSAFGQFPSLQNPEQESKNKFAFEKTSFQQRLLTSSASNWFDVSYYGLNLDIETNPSYLEGDVTVAGICRQDNSQTLTLDLVNTMRIDSVRVNGTPCAFAQSVMSFDITLDRAYQSGDIISAEIFYEGVPVPTGFGSFEFDSHSGVPWVYSLSEPYGARDWWPCKNTQSDKADSADVIITCDSSFKAASQGILVSAVNQNNGKTTYHWKTHYPIASYLISIAVTNYTQFSDWFRYAPADSMEVRNYVLPEDYTAAVAVLPYAVNALGIYSNLFGMYPFIKEKYGHAQFASGGMEHQTMTSIGTFDEKVVVHELAHQWFGDKVTAKTWSDLWLQEGFAVYCTALYLEKTYGEQSYKDYINLQISSGMSAEGETGNPDTSSAQTLFNYDLVYGKGACVLHMLRHMLGDSVFFASLRAYLNQPSLQYANATTHDLEAACETVSGKDLSYFFREWIYGERYPIYQYSWDWNSSKDSSTVSIILTQAPGRTNPAVFTMPIDIRITSPGKDTTITIFNDVQSQTLTLPFPERPSSVLIDPDGWIVKLVYPSSDFAPTSYLLEQNFPNPFNAGTTIKYQLAHAAYVTLKVYDLLGREITTLVNQQQVPGTYQYPWSGQNFASGVYFYRLTAGDVRMQKKMILLK